MRRSKRARRRLLAVGATILVLGLGFGLFKVVRGIQAARLLEAARERGMAAYDTGDYEGCLKDLGYCFARDKNDLDVILKFADARGRIPLPNNQHLIESVVYYDRHALPLIEASPDLPNQDELRREILGKCLETYAALGTGIELLDSAEAILADTPDDIVALKYKAQALAGDRRFDDAAPVTLRLIELEPESLEWRQMYLSVLRGDDPSPERLLAICDEWIADDPADGRYHLLKAELEAQVGNFDGARADALLATEQGSVGEEILGRLVTLLDRLELRDEATSLIVATRRARPDALWVRKATIRRFWLADEVATAIESLEDTRESFDLDNDLRRLEVILYAGLERYDDLASSLATVRAEGDEKDDAWADAIEAWMDRSNRSWPEVMGALQLSYNLEPDNAVINYMMGQSFREVGEHALAMETFERAAKQEPNWVTAAAALTEEMIAVGRANEAYYMARELLRRSPSRHLQAHLVFCRAYLALIESGGTATLIEKHSRDEIDIAELLGRLHQNMPGNVEIASLIVDGYAMTGRKPDAEAFIRGVLDAAELSDEMLTAMSRLSFKHDLDTETDVMARLQTRPTTRLDAAVTEALVLSQQGDVDGSLAVLERVETDEPLDRRRLARARIDIMRVNDDDRALGELRVYAQRYGDLQDLLYVLSIGWTWTDEILSRQTIDALAELLGPASQQVRLAEARWLVTFRSDDDARLAEAIVSIGDVLQESPESIAALTSMAAALQLGPTPDLDRSIGYLEQVVARYPGESGVCVELIAMLQHQGEFTRAQRYLDHLSRLSQHRPELRRAHVALLRQQGDFETARVFAERLAERTSHVSDQLVLASIHERVGKHREAETIYGLLLRDAPDAPMIVMQAADFYGRTARFDMGRQLIVDLDIENAGPTDKIVMLADYCERHGRVRDADRLWSEARELDAASPDLLNRIARFELKKGDIPAAQAAALEALRHDPDHADARMALVIASLQGDARSRRDAIDRLEVAGGAEEMVAVMQVLNACVVGDEIRPNDSQLRQARELVSRYEHFLPAWFLAVMLHTEAGQLGEAADLARRAVGRFPMNSEPSQWATRILVDAGRWSEAIVEAEEWRRRTLHDTMPADLSIAAILIELGRPSDAMYQLEEHEDRLIADDRLEGLALYVEALLRSDRMAAGLRLTTSRLADSERWRTLVMSMCSRLDAESAQALLEEIESIIADGNPIERLRLATRWSSLGRSGDCTVCQDRAEAIAREFESDSKLRLPSLVVLAAVAESRNAYDDAEAVYRSILDMSPQNAVALNNLAAAIIKQDGRESEALAFAQQALSQAPTQPDFLDTKAQALTGLERFDEAEEALLAALDSRPNDVGITLNLAETLLRAGEIERASIRVREAERRIEQSRDPADMRLQPRLDGIRQQLRQASATTIGS